MSCVKIRRAWHWRPRVQHKYAAIAPLPKWLVIVVTTTTNHLCNRTIAEYRECVRVILWLEEVVDERDERREREGPCKNHHVAVLDNLSQVVLVEANQGIVLLQLELLLQLALECLPRGRVAALLAVPRKENLTNLGHNDVGANQSCQLLRGEIDACSYIFATV